MSVSHFMAGPSSRQFPTPNPNDLFCFADGSRIHRSEIAGKVYRGEFHILYAGTRAYYEALKNQEG